MSENTAPEQGENTPVESATDEQLGEGGKRALEAEREANKNLKKELHDALARIGEFEDSQRTDEEKRQHKIAELEKQLAERDAAFSSLERKLLVSEVVAEVGLPVDLAGRLQGDDRDALLADAKQLKEMLAPEGPRKPAPVPEAGSVHGVTARSTADQFADAFSQAFNR